MKLFSLLLGILILVSGFGATATSALSRSSVPAILPSQAELKVLFVEGRWAVVIVPEQNSSEEPVEESVEESVGSDPTSFTPSSSRGGAGEEAEETEQITEDSEDAAASHETDEPSDEHDEGDTAPPEEESDLPAYSIARISETKAALQKSSFDLSINNTLSCLRKEQHQCEESEEQSDGQESDGQEEEDNAAVQDELEEEDEQSDASSVQEAASTEEEPQKEGSQVPPCDDGSCAAEVIPWICAAPQLAEPEPGCHYEFDQDENGCDIPVIVCEPEPEPITCEQSKSNLDTHFEESKDCTEDADCTVYVHACDPYLTCGKPINAAHSSALAAEVQDYGAECGGGLAMCAMCAESTAVCEEGQCVMVQSSP